MKHSIRLLRDSFALTLSLALLAGCLQSPTTPGMTGATRSLASIQNPAKQSAASAISTELGVHLQAERTMRQADLVASVKPAKGYVVLHKGEDHESARTTVVVNNNVTINQIFVQADQRAEVAEQAAKSGYKRLSPREKQALIEAIKQREAKVLARLEDKLDQYLRRGPDKVQAAADGEKAVESEIEVQSTKAKRQVTVIRKYDADGQLIQSIQKLEGVKDGVRYASTRVRTINPDGGATIVTDTEVTVNGKTSQLHMEKVVAADGSFQATGYIKRADGTTVTLASSGSEEGKETVTAKDPKTDVAVEVETNVGTGDATAVVDAGADGQATVPIEVEEPAPAATPPQDQEDQAELDGQIDELAPATDSAQAPEASPTPAAPDSPAPSTEPASPEPSPAS